MPLDIINTLQSTAPHDSRFRRRPPDFAQHSVGRTTWNCHQILHLSRTVQSLFSSDVYHDLTENTASRPKWSRRRSFTTSWLSSLMPAKMTSRRHTGKQTPSLDSFFLLSFLSLRLCCPQHQTFCLTSAWLGLWRSVCHAQSSSRLLTAAPPRLNPPMGQHHGIA